MDDKIKLLRRRAKLLKQLVAVWDASPKDGALSMLLAQLANVNNELHAEIGRFVLEYMERNGDIVKKHPELIVRDLREHFIR